MRLSLGFLLAERVGRRRPRHGATLDAGGSLVTPKWTVVDGTQAAGGTCHDLPPGGDHPQSDDCACCHSDIDADMSFTDPSKHINGVVSAAGNHPPGYDAPSRHGTDANLQVTDCRQCHGADLTGGCSPVTCDDCHPSGWRANCTYCHGGRDNTTSAPPEDIRNGINPATIPVGSHTAHVVGDNHMTYDCTQCHRKPSDVLSAGHAFDGSPGRAELSFSGGLSAGGAHIGPVCYNLYCHGNGRTTGDASTFAGTISSCDRCHPYLNSSGTQWGQMSGDHRKHLSEGVRCHDCHETVTSPSGQILNPELHVNGVKNVRFLGIDYFGGTCSVDCHGEEHESERW